MSNKKEIDESTPLDPMTLAGLKAHDPEKPWEKVIRGEMHGREVLARIGVIQGWHDDEDEDGLREDLDELFDALQEQAEGEGEGDAAPAKAKAKPKSGGEGKQDGDGEDSDPEVSQQESESLDDFDLARYIVRTAKVNRDEILEGMEFGGARSVKISIPDLPERKFDHAHEMVPTLIAATGTREPIMLVGPPGSGKTTAGAQVAEAWGVEFYANSNSRMDTRTLAFGYMDGGGTFRPGYLYEPMKNGGVLLDDEVDASNENVMVSKNTAIENRFAYFPNGERVDAHPDFIYIGSANTFGRGADRMFVGRTQLDAATLDRFIFIEWNYDEALERDLSPNKEWCEWVQRARQVVMEHKMRYIISPRASIKGGKLLAAGIPERQVRFMTVFAGWPQEDVDKVMRSL